MSVIEKFDTISHTITDLMTFIQEDKTVNEEFTNYVNSNLKSEHNNNFDVNDALFSFMLTGRVGEEKKKFTQYYIDKHSKLPKEEKNIVKAINLSLTSLFEVKKVLRNGFELYNIINEQEYTVLPLVKMSHLRGVFAGHYILANIIKYENEHYLIGIKDQYPANMRKEVYKMAIGAIVERPEMFYEDNSKMLKKLEKLVASMHDKFVECFSTDEIITTNVVADELMMLFDNTCHGTVTEEEKSAILAKIEQPEGYQYFEVDELNHFYDDFLEKSLSGFSAHNKTYDVGIIFDKELGLFIIPFYGTLTKIFEAKNYKTIDGYEKCIIKFLENDNIPHTIVYRLAHKYSNFMTVVNKVLGTKYTLEELVQKYKYKHLEQKIFSSTTILYESKLFTETLELMPEENAPVAVSQPEITTSVGRNDACPCGSGKKYKKCCMA